MPSTEPAFVESPELERGGAGERAHADLRMPVLALAAWVGGLTGMLAPPAAPVLAGLLLLFAALAARRGAPATLRLLVCCALVLGAVATGAVLRGDRLASGPVADLARERAMVTGEVFVTSDARTVPGRFEEVVVWHGRVDRVSGRGAVHTTAVPVLLLASEGVDPPPLGSRTRVSGRLAPPDGDDLAGVLLVRGDPVVLESPDPWWRGAAAVRSALRASVAGRPADQRSLVPALVVGDDADMPADLVADFQIAGLTHLTAVSGTNLTLLVGFLLVVARGLGARGRTLYGVALVGILGFLLLARAEPSVVRAATMGTVALLGLGRNGRGRGVRALGVAVTVLLLLDPGLATTVGFALSVLATAGILLLAPPWRDALARWLPRWAAEAVAVPASAQLACTPVVAAISGQVSLVAVVANLLAAPAVAPATVLGLAAGLVGVVWPGWATVLGTLAAWSVAWIVLVARRCADLPTAALDWGAGPTALLGLTVGCVLLAAILPGLLRRPSTGLGCCLLLILAVLTRPPTPGWPPSGWVFVACDVGQGDALVLNAGSGAAVVVDAGPDPAAVDRCLDRLDVTWVPLVVLTHYHADHVDGLSGVLSGRRVGEIDVTAIADPPAQAAAVTRLAGSVPVTTRVPSYAEVRTVGQVRLQVVGPDPRAVPLVTDVTGDEEGSRANDASLVLLVEVAGVRILLTGDVEPPAQRALARTLAGVEVDVLKVPHHGSRHQDLDLLLGLRPRVAVVSVGVDNTYGHPSVDVLGPLAAAGAIILRTDVHGDVLVVVRGAEVSTLTTRGS